MIATLNKREQNDTSVVVNDILVKEVPTIKYLGVTFDRHFTFIPHVVENVAKARRKLGVLRHSLCQYGLHSHVGKM